MKKYLMIVLALFSLFSFTLAPVSAHEINEESLNTKQERIEAAKHRAEDAKERAEAFREQAKERVEEIRANAREKRAEIKKEVCERLQSKLSTIPSRVRERASKHQEVFDKIYGRVQSFYDKGQLTVDNYDELKAAVDTAQTNSAAAVLAVEEVEITIDCDNPKIGEQLDEVRTAAQEARSALKEYRSKLVELISALKSAAAQQKTNDNTEEES